MVNVRLPDFAGTDVRDSEFSDGVSMLVGAAVTVIDRSPEQAVLVDDWQTFT